MEWNPGNWTKMHWITERAAPLRNKGITTGIVITTTKHPHNWKRCCGLHRGNTSITSTAQTAKYADVSEWEHLRATGDNCWGNWDPSHHSWIGVRGRTIKVLMHSWSVTFGADICQHLIHIWRGFSARHTWFTVHSRLVSTLLREDTIKRKG